MADRPSVDTSNVYGDDVLERELRDALKSEPEIELFKLINKSLRVRAELADTETVKIMLSQMWSNVADFFEVVTEVPTLGTVGLLSLAGLVLVAGLLVIRFRLSS